MSNLETTSPEPKVTLVEASAVMLANDVNQSIFTPMWLRDSGILLNDELQSNEIVLAPGITRIPSEEFELLVLPDRVQMRITQQADRAAPLISRILGGVARTLPHTPFIAVGLNFQHELVPSDAAGFHSWNKAYLAAPWAVTSVQDDARTRFGCSFAYDAFDGARMRVRAAVSAKRRDEDPAQGSLLTLLPYVVNVHSNLHRDIPPAGRVPELIRILSLWEDVLSEAQKHVERLRV